MSESLNIGKTENYEARVKGMLATVISEADRQREIWNLSNKAQKSLREAAGLNANEPASSIVKRHRSNAENRCVDPVRTWRRQYQIPTDSVGVSGHLGVTGLACGEGYSREDGRSHIFPVRGMKYMVIKNPTAGFYHVFHNPEVNPAISRSEMPDNEIWEVRPDNSSDEFSVMEMDAKCPDFCERFPNSSWLSELPERKREGIVHEK
ncbi:MAG: hypothetical protein ACYDCP_01825 [Thermoplasmataceae archaeon]